MKKFILFATIALSAMMTHAQCAANFSYSVSGNSVQFTNSSAGTTYYQWHFGDGAASNASNPSHTYSAAGTYDVCLYAYYSDSSGGFCADTLCQLITVQDSTGNTPCSANFSWTITGNTVQFNNTSTGTNSNQWSFGDGGYSYTNNPTHTYSSPGTYSVCLYSYYDDSLQVICADSICQVVYVNDSLDSTASVKPVVLDAFELFPNPATTVLNVKMENVSANTYASITDLVGREMTRVELTSQLTEISVIDLPNGVYIVQLIDADQQLIGMRKFIRQ